MNPIELTLPMPPNLANGRGHSRWSGAQKKRYFQALDERQQCGMIPPPPHRPLDSVRLQAAMYLRGTMDDDNAKFRAYKWPADWLRTRGYIVDDKRPHCTMEDPTQHRKQRDENAVVIITISPISRED